MKKLLTVSAVALLALTGCAASDTTSIATEPSSSASSPEPQEVIQSSIEDSILKSTYETYRENYGEATDEEILAQLDQTCTDLEAALDSGETFGSYLVSQAMVVEDSEKLGFLLAGSITVRCPELTDHPNYD